MRTNLLYALAVLFLFSGCSKDNPKPRTEPDPEKIHLLQRKTSEISFPDGSKTTITWDHLYNQDNKLTMIDAVLKEPGNTQSLRTSMTYDADGKLHQVTNEAGMVWTHFYDNQKRLVKLEESHPNAGTITYTNSFNTLGRLVEQKTYAGAVSDANLTSSMRASYGRADIVTLKRYTANGEAFDEFTIRTDDKRRPLPLLPQQISVSFQSADMFSEGLFTEHNIVSREDVKIKPSDAKDGSFTASYSYNEAGYPAASIRTYKSGAVEVTTYDYVVK